MKRNEKINNKNALIRLSYDRTLDNLQHIKKNVRIHLAILMLPACVFDQF